LESVPFGIALRVAPGRGDHHGQITAAIEGVSHTLAKKSALQAAAPHLRNCGRAGEQGDPLMNTKRARSGGLALNLREEARALIAR